MFYLKNFFLKIFGETVKWRADPKVDSHNEEVIEQLRRVPKPQVCIRMSLMIITTYFKRYTMKNVLGKQQLHALIHTMKTLSNNL